MNDLSTAGDRLLNAFTQTFLGVAIWRIIAAGVIMIFTLLMRKIVVSFLIRIFRKLTAKTENTIDDQIVEALDPPARLIVITLGIIFALQVLGFAVTNDTFAGHLVRTLFIFAIFWSIYRSADIIKDILVKISERAANGLDDIVLPYITRGIKVLVVIIAISVIAKEWRYDVGAILAGLGLGGLAFALAAQETLANFFGGLTIMIDKPFIVGDLIQTTTVEGTVEDIGFRSTKLRTAEHALVSVPNSIIAKGAITNWSKMGKRRIKFNLGIRYDTSTSQIEALLKRVRTMLTDNPQIHPDTIFVYFDAFGESSYDLFFNFFTKTTKWQDYLKVKEEVNLELLHILDDLNICIEYPSTSVYMEGKGNPAGTGTINMYEKDNTNHTGIGAGGNLENSTGNNVQ